MEWFVQNYNIISIVFFLIIAAVAHLVTPSSYDWRENSISELAAQRYNNKWIMQIGLFGFGVILGGGILMRLAQAGLIWFIELPILIYAISISLSGVFCTRPFIEGSDFSQIEDRAHSIFANLTGISFSLGVVVRMVFVELFVDFILNTVFLLLVLVPPFAFSRASKRRGIVQRGIFFLGFLWLILLY
jgi:hypothetical protein